MKAAERLLTVVITATITSAAWIVFGGSLLGSQFFGNDTEPATPVAEGAERQTVPESVVSGPVTDNRARSVNLNDSTPIESSAIDQLVIPVMGTASGDLVDSYADSRSGGDRLHEAIDIMADEGTSVVSAGPGTIERLFRSDAGGNTIYIRSEDGKTVYYYAHLAEYAPGIGEGQRIRRGQRIGTVGSTGNADPSAPHLHFAILRTTEQAKWWEPANAVNPYTLLKRAVAPR